jgi:MiaB-like tRNA modifying enzyme
MTKVFFQTHGCTVNFSESEIMKGLLEKAGFSITSEPGEADVAVINICTVKGENTAIREVRKFKEEYPDKKLVVAGCLTKELIKELRKISESASLISTHNINMIVEIVEEVINGNTIEAVSEKKGKKILLPRVRKNPLVGIIPILSGCNNNCSYCSVKLVKGKLESYPQEDIIKEVEHALMDGCKELWITSQDNASYGTEKVWRSSLPELLKEILKIDKDFRLRIGMMNPKHLSLILDDMIGIYKDKRVFKFLHVPIQSGDDGMLKKMRRNYSVEEFKEIISRFRKAIPKLTVSTDIIVGFPGETEENFSKSLQLIKELKPEVLNISRFIPRPGTEACYMKDKLDGGLVKDRSRVMTDIFQNISRMNNEKWYNWTGEILIDEKGKDNTLIGRNDSYKQVIVTSNHKLGDRIEVRVRNTGIFDLRGEKVDY